MLDSPDKSIRNSVQHPERKLNPHGAQVERYMSMGLPEPEARNFVAAGLTLGRVRRDASNIKLSAEEYKKQSLIDPLTCLYNRRHLDGDVNSSGTVLGTGMLTREFNEALRSKPSLSIIMIDIDDFRGYNNRYGHPAGDIVLKTVADTIRRSIRNTDLPFRYGGEEFLILSPETNLAGATTVAERLRKAIEEISTLRKQVTVSVGISTYHEREEVLFNQVVKDKDQLLQLADNALYFSKNQGKNRVTAGNNLTDEQVLEADSQIDK